MMSPFSQSSHLISASIQICSIAAHPDASSPSMTSKCSSSPHFLQKISQLVRMATLHDAFQQLACTLIVSSTSSCRYLAKQGIFFGLPAGISCLVQCPDTCINAHFPYTSCQSTRPLRQFIGTAVHSMPPGYCHRVPCYQTHSCGQ